MYIFLKSTDSLQSFPYNKANHFIVKLPEMLSFKSKKCMCCLVDIIVPEVNGQSIREVLILTNFVSENYVGSKRLPVIQRLVKEDEKGFNQSGMNNYYSAVKDIETDLIEVRILDGKNFQYVPFDADGVTYCTFHFIKV